MEMLYSQGYVCYLQASQMNDLIEKSALNEHALGALEKVARIFQKKQREFEHRYDCLDNGIRVHSSLFSNEMIISYVHSNENGTGIMEGPLKFVLNDICDLLDYFRKEGITLEGGIAYDDVYSSGNINIGPAIVKAVLAKPKTESGIWLDKEIIVFVENKEIFSHFISGARLNVR